MSFLAELRQKPSETKVQYAFAGAFVLTFVIAGIWTTTLPARFAAIGTSVESSDVQTASVQEGFGDFVDGIDDIVLTAELDQGKEESLPPSFEPTGALGGLSIDEDNVSSASSSPTVHTEASTPSGAGGSTTGATGTSSTPRIIQIGTTTKKAE